MSFFKSRRAIEDLLFVIFVLLSTENVRVFTAILAFPLTTMVSPLSLTDAMMPENRPLASVVGPPDPGVDSGIGLLTAKTLDATIIEEIKMPARRIFFIKYRARKPRQRAAGRKRRLLVLKVIAKYVAT